MDAETREAIKRLAVAIDGVTGMAAGAAAYIATLDGAAFVDRRKALGLSRKLVPEGLSGDASVSPAKVAQAMIEQIGSLAREIESLKQRLTRPATIEFEREDDRSPRENSFRSLSRFTRLNEG